LNISCQGKGNAVLIKSGYPYQADTKPNMIQTMQHLNPPANGIGQRPIHKLCKGQTLLCRALGLNLN
jgi:DNA-3-methyladenine glycosylase